MKLPDWLRGKSDVPKPPDLPLPKVDPKVLVAEQDAAKEQAERKNRAQARQEKPGPASRHLAGKYPAEPLKTDGPKPGTQPLDLPQRVPSQLRNDPTPQRAPDQQTPGQGVEWVRQLTPTGTKVVPKPAERPSFEEAKKIAEASRTNSDRDRGGR